jgi:hypothetical protein
MTDRTTRRTPSLAPLDRLRAYATAYPSYGAEQIRRRLTTKDDDAIHADLMILLAETYHRQGLRRAAIETIADAALCDARLPPYSPRRLATLAVSADLAVFDARVGALPACNRYLDAAIHTTRPNSRRVLHAEALHTVAVYHHSSCVRGRAQLAMLTGRLPPADSVAVMLRHAIAAMDDGCRPGCQTPPTRPPPPLPGGVLRPDLHTPPTDYLASRVTRHPPTHTCVFVPTPA